MKSFGVIGDVRLCMFVCENFYDAEIKTHNLVSKLMNAYPKINCVGMYCARFHLCVKRQNVFHTKYIHSS